jgi:hypothetical protein
LYINNNNNKDNFFDEKEEIINFKVDDDLMNNINPPSSCHSIPNSPATPFSPQISSSSFDSSFWQPRPTLVLDLDETLVHCETDLTPLKSGLFFSLVKIYFF